MSLPGRSPLPPPAEISKSSSALESTPGGNIYNTLTISEDRSAGSTIEERNRLALRKSLPISDTPTISGDRNEGISRDKKDDTISILSRPPPAGLPGNHALQDYQMQMMLLEQQNKRRLWMARGELQQLHKNDSTRVAAQPPVSPYGRIDECHFEKGNPMDVENNNASSSEAQALRERIVFLETKLKRLESTESNQVPSRHQVLYRLEGYNPTQDKEDDISPPRGWSGPFLDPPELVHGQIGAAHLRCSVPLNNFELYLAMNKDVSFIVFRNFRRTMDAAASAKNNAGCDREPHHPRPFSETIRPVADDLKKALEEILGSGTEYKQILSKYLRTQELSAPYLFIYHSRHRLDGIRNRLSPPAQKQLDLLLDYVKSTLGDQYAAADSLLARKKILPEYVDYLFKPGDVLVSNEGNEYTGYIATSWPSPDRNPPVHIADRESVVEGFGDPPNRKAPTQSWTIDGWSWRFNGSFYREKKKLRLEMPTDNHRTENTMEAETGKSCDAEGRGNPIAELAVFPIQYASNEIVERLRQRGRTFWKCRIRRFVSYQANSQESLENMAGERYMIDMKTYRSLHPENSYSGYPRDDLGTDVMAKDEPPDEQFELLLPPKIKGYNLLRKKWYDLSADRISNVVWNREAFKSLVIDHKAKNLIRALVSNHLESERSTDLIAGKGNGLILLLHGGPGTGKTLTAESVAEIAEKPLYRVTCGDVGVQPEEVEKYLESVLHLGRIWGCVVLLDEADVFLEQRSLKDLARNALVSVFLRVLEYYDGILILTSNRVGTFDEAFKSRIQLALHYPSLGPHQRLQIWKTFIDRLESFEDEDIDISDLRGHLDELKEEKLNGRQIRNAITIARQYAKWTATTLTYEHLKDVIEVSGRFDTYIDKLHGVLTPDEFTEDEGLQFA